MRRSNHIPKISDLIISDTDIERDETPSYDGLQRLASLWIEQVDAFDSLPPQSWGRDYVKFSPSQADNCLRELFFINTNAPRDDVTETPWKNRRRRNGDAYHAETEKVYETMVQRLRDAGLNVYFEVVAIEHRDRIRGEGRYIVGGREVVVEGRPDMILRYVGDTIPGVIETGEYVLLDLKAKAKLSSVSGVRRGRVPEYNIAQMHAYSLCRFTTEDGRIFDNIDKAILHYESLEKMREAEEESKDIVAVVVKSTDDDRKRLLLRWAKVVDAVEKGEAPPPERDKCYWCAYKQYCAAVEVGDAP